MSGSMVDIQYPMAKIRRGKKKRKKRRRRRRRNHRAKIECPHLLRRAAITNSHRQRQKQNRTQFTACGKTSCSEETVRSRVHGGFLQRLLLHYAAAAADEHHAFIEVQRTAWFRTGRTVDRVQPRHVEFVNTT